MLLWKDCGVHTINPSLRYPNTFYVLLFPLDVYHMAVWRHCFLYVVYANEDILWADAR